MVMATTAMMAEMTLLVTVLMTALTATTVRADNNQQKRRVTATAMMERAIVRARAMVATMASMGGR